ncbi:hypothetical protein [Chryseobacterium sp. CBo1]|uniref:hypothetical protein n=1 Tax=Chryseobacterium sp. CBo1 TaxID=1869230 RepID=UPI000F4F79D4|nr:hypothetical protein [Chryseobacterium sp. CBo1]
MDYQVGQTVYDVGINFKTKKATVREQKILYVGDQVLFVTGIDCVWGEKNEITLRYSMKDAFKPERIFESTTHTVWTDDRERAYQYAHQMNEIQKMKLSISKAC